MKKGWQTKTLGELCDVLDNNPALPNLPGAETGIWPRSPEGWNGYCYEIYPGNINVQGSR